MYNRYCKNCNNLIEQWYCYNKKDKLYNIIIYCDFADSKNNDSIYFLDCKNCKKFVGILCLYVCTNCFGKDDIYGEKNLFNFFFKYRISQSKYGCKNCNKINFKWQRWLFEELTFYKK